MGRSLAPCDWKLSTDARPGIDSTANPLTREFLKRRIGEIHTEGWGEGEECNFRKPETFEATHVEGLRGNRDPHRRPNVSGDSFPNPLMGLGVPGDYATHFTTHARQQKRGIDWDNRLGSGRLKTLRQKRALPVPARFGGCGKKANGLVGCLIWEKERYSAPFLKSQMTLWAIPWVLTAFQHRCRTRSNHNRVPKIGGVPEMRPGFRQLG